MYKLQRSEKAEDLGHEGLLRASAWLSSLWAVLQWDKRNVCKRLYFIKMQVRYWWQIQTYKSSTLDFIDADKDILLQVSQQGGWTA